MIKSVKSSYIILYMFAHMIINHKNNTNVTKRVLSDKSYKRKYLISRSNYVAKSARGKNYVSISDLDE
jgi:hypothetical protein